MLAMLYQLEQTQWWTPEQLLAQQMQQLTLLLRHAYATVPFYRERLRAAGFDPKQRLTPEGFRALPLLTRREVQRAGTALHTTALPKAYGQTGETTTTGSTGEPVRVRRTQVDQILWEANTLRDHHWHQRDFSAKLALIRTGTHSQQSPGGARMNNWGRPAAELYRTGPMVLLSANQALSVQAQWVLRENPDYLMVYPSLLRALIGEFLACGERPTRLREVRTIGETMDDDLREYCRREMNVPVVDAYSSEEMGYIALQCPVSGMYHVMAESVLLEILDEQGNPCAPGQAGRVVATSLHNAAMPLIRYVLGDYAEAGAACPCGRGLPTVARIVGKLRHLLTLPTGERFRPLFWNELKPFPMVRQYQMIQQSPTEIETRLVTDVPLDAATEARLCAALQRAAHYPFHFKLQYFAGELPRGPRGKFEDFVSRVSPDGSGP
jgi:phenylacetate-CoA ligase